MKMIKYIVVVLMTISFNSFSQSDSCSIANIKPRYGMDIMIFPALVYNNITLGFNWSLKPKIEHNVSIVSSLFVFGNANIAAKVDYTANFYFKNLKNYWNVWTRISNVKVEDTNYEEGGPIYNSWYNSIGVGLGRKNKIGKKIALRTELGVGASFVLRNGNHVRFPFDDLHSYSLWNNNNQTPSSLLPVVIPMLRFKTVFILNFKSKNFK
jgi:hypothetical protein